MTPKFERAVNDLLIDEGGYVNHPNDPGGETKYGITKRTYPREDIRGLTVDRAKAIYYHDWWVPMGLEDIPDPLCAKMLNVAVNMGKRRAWKLLQRALNDVTKANLVVDGVFGPASQRALQFALQSPPAQTVTNLLGYYQLDRYEYLARANAKFRSFIRGWRLRAKRYITRQ